MSILRRLLASAIVLVLLPTTFCSASATMNAKYHIFKRWPNTAIKPGDPPYSHPLLKDGRGYVVVFSVQEEDILKVAFYYNDDETSRNTLLYISNPERRSFAGMAADATYDAGRDKDYGVRFEDGTTLYAPLPPSDVYPSGTREWMYQMRWRRVYGNYYLITVFRSMGNAVQEELMTERDNKDLRPILGDSSAEEHPRFGGAIICNSLDYIDEQGKRISYELVPVEEKDLPPDFPKGLVRWLP
ncbi:hypothetical protein QUW15_00880 [Desulfovibrio piger]|nr:hypothetical protein [Desulfovibrio piger]